MSNLGKVRRFHDLMGIDPGYDSIPMRKSLIEEEAFEVDEALGDMHWQWKFGGEDLTKYRQHVAKELADLLYVVYGTAVCLGIDLDKVFDEVHKSNLSKLDNDGLPVRREDGKVTKGPNYKAPDLSFIEME